MIALRLQSVLASAAIAAAMMLHSAQAQAGYVSVAEWAELDTVASLRQPVASLFVEYETPSVTAYPQIDSDAPRAPDLPSAPLLRLFPPVCNLGDSEDGISSYYAPGNGPSSPPTGDLPRPQVPPLEPIHLLPTQTGASHPFSVASFVFRLPRPA